MVYGCMKLTLNLTTNALEGLGGKIMSLTSYLLPEACTKSWIQCQLLKECPSLNQAFYALTCSDRAMGVIVVTVSIAAITIYFNNKWRREREGRKSSK